MTFKNPEGTQMDRLNKMLDHIKTPDLQCQSLAQQHLDRLTKPPGSLGRLEELAAWYIRVRGKFPPTLPKKALFVFAADHGVCEEGVSAFPQSVTAQMVFNFLKGGAAVNVLARHADAEVRVVDMGVDFDFGEIPTLIHRKIARGTQNMSRGPAMTQKQALAAVITGIDLAEEAAKNGVTLLGTGEMGIGNTTASSAITAVLTGSDIATVTGRGTGIGDETLVLKQAVVRLALNVNQPEASKPLELLQKIGGFEIGGITGLILGGAAHRIPIVIDGFIATAAALIAAALKPEVTAYLLAAHQSAEPGHQIALKHLGLSPLLAFDMRLGEGTGAALGMSMVDAAIKIVNEMATFEQAGVSQKEDDA